MARTRTSAPKTSARIDGGWNGRDVVEIVTDLIRRHGIDVDEPVTRYIVATRELEAEGEEDDDGDE